MYILLPIQAGYVTPIQVGCVVYVLVCVFTGGFSFVSRKSVFCDWQKNNQAYKVSKKTWKQEIQYQTVHQLNQWLLQKLLEIVNGLA